MNGPSTAVTCAVSSRDLSSGDRELDRCRAFQIVAEPSLDDGLALAKILDLAVLLHHRNVVPGHHDGAGPAAPQLPNGLDRGRADGGVIARVGAAADELGAVLGGVA